MYLTQYLYDFISLQLLLPNKPVCHSLTGSEDSAAIEAGFQAGRLSHKFLFPVFVSIYNG